MIAWEAEPVQVKCKIMHLGHIYTVENYILEISSSGNNERWHNIIIPCMIKWQRKLFQVFEVQTVKVVFWSRKFTLLLEYCFQILCQFENTTHIYYRVCLTKRTNEQGKELIFHFLAPKNWRLSGHTIYSNAEFLQSN